ncbi:hypothetical protein HDU87_006728 [Geranomyces variabilis]|uniref:Myb-like, SWIRM and MPN domain-containing protein 1 n=1 Tax=Geranomyces variabilis TaxID=109894 RepID=A0AAD5TPR2_9FUNG|nr:hypothetical protein HDU87_006728 [Geranomyces variabilis]
MAGTAQLQADEAFARALQFADLEADSYNDLSPAHDDDRDDGAYQLEHSDDDYSATRGKGKKRRSKKVSAQGPAKRGRKPKAAVSLPVVPSAHAGDQALVAPAAESEASSLPDATSAAKPAAAATMPDMTGILVGKWTEAEEKAFLEGLDLFGRDWKKLTNHIKTRLCDGVKSHAQKHFIHLWLAGQPLPDKVRESGNGHTLSGNPLNPESAAVRPYLKSSKRANFQPEIATSESSGASADPSNGWPAHSRDAKSKADRKPPKRKDEPVRVERNYALPAVGPDGKTDYSRNRPRRETRAARGPYAEDEYDLVPCPPFGKDPGDIQQPYTLTVERTAVALIDLHSHLLDTEVVGLLAGSYDEQAKACKVSVAIPAKRKALESRDASITVEASEESLAAALATADAHGLHIVGWYHSHPVFSTLPSRIDCETQRMHQKAFGGGEIGSGGRPFLGAICGPYNPELKTSQSELNWFVVPTASAQSSQPHSHHDSDAAPRQLTAVLAGHDAAAFEGVSPAELDNMLELIKAHAQPCYDSDRHKFGSLWRPISSAPQSGTAAATIAAHSPAGGADHADDAVLLAAASPPPGSPSSPPAPPPPALQPSPSSPPLEASPSSLSSSLSPSSARQPQQQHEATRAAKLAESIGAWLLGPHYNQSVLSSTTTADACDDDYKKAKDGDADERAGAASATTASGHVSVRSLLRALIKELDACDGRTLTLRP